MQKYEYECKWIWGFGKKHSKILNEYGNQGWELVSVNFNLHYFRRAID
jgi:hypothetical protein